jgi:hypothetical protein
MTERKAVETGPVCVSLHFFPPEENQLYVIASFDDGTKKYIYDVDEVEGKEVI